MGKKYIDADKLKAHIQYLIRKDNYELFDVPELLSFIDSLQQEQPAKRGYKDCNGCEYNRTLKDQIGWQFRGCFGGDYKGKPIAEIELCPLKVANLQEQQEVDLEKELDQWRHEHFVGQRDGYYNGEYLERSSQLEIARHFFDLGLNAKKEENK